MPMKRKRKVYGASLPPQPRRRKSYATMPSLCLDCGQPIHLGDVSVAITNESTYRHSCGRVLYDPAHGEMRPML